MEFKKFKESVSKVKNLELPGEKFQYKMAPIERLQELKRKALEMNIAKKAGVLALFYPDYQEQAKLILILRKTYTGVHSAQVGFPGGKFEILDTSLEDTALRETQEEIGVPKKDITIFKKLTQMYVPPSNFIVQPFLGITEKTPNFILQETEVEALIEVAISHFMEDSILISKKITTSYATDLDVPAYLLNNHVVWGATAMMLSEIRQLLKQVL
ncbi:MAG: coenzyme A pyrophosphatase [Bacteroidetes bacterium HGW-Bacteroidetes-2]|jgi:8-oxo-dGTP pyrophosphatase MutT (NUDIX family)|nr:MAG: coenzyme A pyrophosphatase [Bacteroidetes bacterium HGW-Bacteroidetes-2]